MKSILVLILFTLSLPTIGVGQATLVNAIELMDNGSYDLAAEAFEKMLVKEGDALDMERKLLVRKNLANCYGKLEQQEKQIEQLDKIIREADLEQNTILVRESYKVLIEEIYPFRDVNKTMELSQEAEAFEKEYGDNDSYARMLLTTGGIYYYLQQYSKGLQKYLEAYEVAELPRLKMEALLYLADSNRNDEMDFSDSLFRKAIGIAELLNDSLAYSTAYGQFGNYLLRKGKQQEAIESILIAIDYRPKSKIFDFVRIQNYTTISQLFYGIKNFNRAAYYIERAIDLAEKRNYSSRNGTVAFVYGQVLAIQGKDELSYQEFLKAEKYYKEKGKTRKYINTVSELGIIDLNKNDLQKAEKRFEVVKAEFNYDKIGFSVRVGKFETLMFLKKRQFDEAITVAQKTFEDCDNSETATCKMVMLELLAKAYRASGNTAKAISVLEAYHEIKDSVFQSSQNQIVFDLESKYKRKEQDQSLALLNVENKLSTEKLSRQKFVITIGAIALGLISLLSFFLFSLYKRINNQKQIIQKALSEKDVLLREIHHRVKNNLQLVSSLLTLQSRSITDESAIAAINDGKARVRSMALIHQDLYNKENLTGISVKGYIEKLSKEIFHTYNISEDIVQLELHVEDIDLDVETVVPLGLIINELITNSLKYAFPENQKGNIEISLKEKAGKLILKLEDNGVGLDPSEFQSATSFGNRLVNILTDQLDGKISVSSENGTLVSIEINSYNIAA